MAAILTLDIPGIFFGEGPLGALGATAAQAGIGFMEAHGLALILAILMGRATAFGAWAGTADSRSWHVTGAAIHALLGSANLLAACGALGRIVGTAGEPSAAAA